MSQSHTITGCRVCGGTRLHPILDLGRTALANRFLRAGQLADPEPKFPLRLALCGDCGLVQIDETVSPDVLFGEYLYVSGTSDAVVRHAGQLAERCIDRFELGGRDLVCEIASNDGTVLKAFQARGVRTLGVEPAANVADMARAAGVETVPAYFGADTAVEIRHAAGPAKLVIARHVLAHVADTNGFVRGVARLLADDGAAVFEVPHLLPFFTNIEYDTVYHEHLCYFSVRVLCELMGRHDLEVVDVEETHLHGGSVLVTVQRHGGPRFARSSVDRVLARELEVGLHRPEPWVTFGRRVAVQRAALRDEVESVRASGRVVAGYGAAAKGMTLLAACGLGADHLPFIADKNPLKQGLYTPGHHVPVVGPERIAAERPDVLLVLAWNFANEVMAQQAAFRKAGGKFLLPLPRPHYPTEAGTRLMKVA